MADENNKPATGNPKERTTNWTEILKVVAMPLVITVVGLIINSSLSERQNRESNLRLYADMMARREQADSDLRKDMFTNILNKFNESKPNQSVVEHLEQQVMNLELMAYNFNESIDLGPLFQHLQRQIPRRPPGATPAQAKRFEDMRNRLERVAVEVDERQLAVFGDSGVVVRTPADNLAQISKSPASIMFGGPSAIPTKGAKPDDDVNQVCLGLNAADDNQTHYRRFRLEVIDFDPVSREIQVRLYVSKLLAEPDCRSVDLDLSSNAEMDIHFWVGLFDFPMIDNTRLSHSERCSISLTFLSADLAQLALAYFPASRASLKDKPYYDELEHDLLHMESKPTKTPTNTPMNTPTNTPMSTPTSTKR